MKYVIKPCLIALSSIAIYTVGISLGFFLMDEFISSWLEYNVFNHQPMTVQLANIRSHIEHAIISLIGAIPLTYFILKIQPNNFVRYSLTASIPIFIIGFTSIWNLYHFTTEPPFEPPFPTYIISNVLIMIITPIMMGLLIKKLPSKN